jgi:uncharacterized protein YndB with AHSA1/START domain
VDSPAGGSDRERPNAMSTPAADDYTRELPFAAPRERVYDALTTLQGLAGWWTALVSGTPTTGGEIEFAFAGLDEKILMRVEDATTPSSVIWSCLTHIGHPEWQGTRIVFELTQTDDGPGGILSLRHIGLNPALSCYQTCQNGWDHFLASLISYAQDGNGTPF